MKSTSSRAVLVMIGALAFAVAIVFAAYSDIRWEDYYITLRASRNLVEGHGLVFQPGERLHTFTSPLGVLIPALCLWVTPNEQLALWLFRVLSAAALGVAAALIFDIALRLRFGIAALVLLIGCTVLDAKTLTFVVSGMETGFMVLFLAWMLRTLLLRPSRFALQLGVGFAGLMWTRPDGCVYIAALSVACLLFSPTQPGEPEERWKSFRHRLRLLIHAALLCAAIYLPWFIFAWSYYGTPVPHTVLAKSITGEAKSLTGFGWHLLTYPLQTLRGHSIAGHGWLPHYFGMGGWPLTAALPARALDLVAFSLWLLPFIRWEARLASFAATSVHFYLGYIPIFVFPWYYPPVQWLVVFALAAFVQQLCNGLQRLERGGIARAITAQLRLYLSASAGLLVAGTAILALLVCSQLHQAQRIVENEVRRAAGRWLHEHAQPGDTVALEPLGYIGYYSKLKTYDFLGLSSTEVTELRRTNAWSPQTVVSELRPSWVVLRHGEPMAETIAADYELAAEFNRTEEVRRLNIPGQAYLEFDSHLLVYRRRS